MHGLFTKDNKAEWSPGRSEIIRLVTNKIERPRGASPICLITRMITDRLDDTKLGYQLIIKITIFVTRDDWEVVRWRRIFALTDLRNLFFFLPHWRSVLFSDWKMAPMHPKIKRKTSDLQCLRRKAHRYLGNDDDAIVNKFCSLFLWSGSKGRLSTDIFFHGEIPSHTPISQIYERNCSS